MYIWKRVNLLDKAWFIYQKIRSIGNLIEHKLLLIHSQTELWIMN